MNAHFAEYLVHFSNVLMLVSYSVRDILWLRWFAVAAALTNIPYFLLQRDVLWPGPLGPGVHHHQSFSDRAHLPGTTPRGALRRRAAALQHGISLAPAARVRVVDARGRMEGWRCGKQDADRGSAGRIDLHR